ncbi:MAG: hypothetical protein QF833_03290 [Alphaproteobacteria bacterium]|nr:hypothetical protein [Alphaproteobacteria bacterium]
MDFDAPQHWLDVDSRHLLITLECLQLNCALYHIKPVVEELPKRLLTWVYVISLFVFPDGITELLLSPLLVATEPHNLLAALAVEAAVQVEDEAPFVLAGFLD